MYRFVVSLSGSVWIGGVVFRGGADTFSDEAVHRSSREWRSPCDLIEECRCADVIVAVWSVARVAACDPDTA